MSVSKDWRKRFIINWYSVTKYPEMEIKAINTAFIKITKLISSELSFLFSTFTEIIGESKLDREEIIGLI